MRDFRKLKIWQASHHLTLDLYSLTKSFPTDERYGLISQIRRASASIPANIAEGCGTSSEAAFTRYLQIAISSASELQYHLILAHDLEYLDRQTFHRYAGELDEV